MTTTVALTTQFTPLTSRYLNYSTERFYRFHKPQVDALLIELGVLPKPMSKEACSEFVSGRQAIMSERSKVSAVRHISSWNHTEAMFIAY